LEIEKFGAEVGGWRQDQLKRDKQSLWPDRRVPIALDPQDIVIIVTGGAGKHTGTLGVPGAMHSVTRRIRMPGERLS
ncbi:MAG: hypothetical protein AAB502_01370, partial [Chloroflexota bacterium]